MKKLICAFGIVAVSSAFAGWNLNLSSGWRIVGGANCNSGLRTDLNVSGARALPNMPAFVRPAGATKAEAEAASKAVLDGQRVDLPNGGFIDPDYAGREALPDMTWNWRAPAGSYTDGAMNFSYDYVEVSSIASGGLVAGSGTEHDIPGFNIEIQRNLGQWGDFGLDLGFGFNYFRRTNVHKASGAVYRRTDTVERGSYTSSVAMDPTWADMARNPDGSYGAGSYDGPGALLPLVSGGGGAFSFGSRLNGLSSTTHTLYLDTAADYEEIELTLTAKPYYEITDWFRVVGTLGIAVSRGQLDFDMLALSDGSRVYADAERFRQWDCYGLGGLGGLFHAWNMCLGFDFLARFLDRDIKVDGRNVSGSVERSPWMFRVYAGFEF